MKRILFIGDQLTVERARGSQDVRVNSETIEEALLGLEPAVADWHAEANYLQVHACTYMYVLCVTEKLCIIYRPRLYGLHIHVHVIVLCIIYI